MTVFVVSECCSIDCRQYCEGVMLTSCQQFQNILGTKNIWSFDVWWQVIEGMLTRDYEGGGAGVRHTNLNYIKMIAMYPFDTNIHVPICSETPWPMCWRWRAPGIIYTISHKLSQCLTCQSWFLHIVLRNGVQNQSNLSNIPLSREFYTFKAHISRNGGKFHFLKNMWSLIS